MTLSWIIYPLLRYRGASFIQMYWKTQFFIFEHLKQWNNSVTYNIQKSFSKMTILYEDKQIKITTEYITINKYYFPLATSKTILFSEIQRFILQDATGVNTSWGISSSWLNNWFPYDGERKTKTKFLEITMKGKKVKPSITPQNVEEVFRILSEHFSSRCQTGELKEKDTNAIENATGDIIVAK